MLTKDEADFLTRVNSGAPLRAATGVEDRLRQRLRKQGLVEVLKNPRRWSVTGAGNAALENAKQGNSRGHG